MDADVGGIREPVSPDDSASRASQGNEEPANIRGEGMDSESDISEELDTSKQITGMEKGPTNPAQSSVSDVSSEEGGIGSLDHGIGSPDHGSISPDRGEPEARDKWERVADTHFESGLTGIGSPKEEKLDYGGIDEDEHGVLLSPNADLGSGSNVLDRRKSGSPGGDDDVIVESVFTQDEDEAQDQQGGMMERVSDQSEDEGDVYVEDQSNKPEHAEGPDESIDNVSDQSDDEGSDSVGHQKSGPPHDKDESIDNVSEEEEDISIEPRHSEKQDHQSIDDVSDQSEDEGDIGIGRHMPQTKAATTRTIVSEMLDNVSDQSAENSPQGHAAESQPTDQRDDEMIDNVSHQSDEASGSGPQTMENEKITEAQTSRGKGMIDDVSDDEQPMDATDGGQTQTRIGDDVSEPSEDDEEAMEGYPTGVMKEGVKDGSMDNVSDQSEDDSDSGQPSAPPTSKHEMMDNVSDQSGNDSEEDRPPEPPGEETKGGMDDNMMDNVSDQSDNDFDAERPPEPPAEVADEDIDNVSDQSADEPVEAQPPEQRVDKTKDEIMDDMSNLFVDNPDGDQYPEAPPGIGSAKMDRSDIAGNQSRAVDGQRDVDVPGMREDEGGLDDVSDQSDMEDDKKLDTIGKSRTNAGGGGEKGLVEQSQAPQEELDNVSEQSDADQKENIMVPGEIRETGKEDAPSEEDDRSLKGLDGVSDSKNNGSVTKKMFGEGPVEGITSPVQPVSKETSSYKDAVVDVHHHGDDLDFEEDVEEQEKGDKKAGDNGEKQEEAKPGPARKTTEEEGELESGEEDETKDGTTTGDGEIEEEEEAEEGEVKDPEDRKIVRRICHFFTKGRCTWGPACRFLHPGVNDMGNYSFIDFKEIEQNTMKLLNKEPEPPPPPEQTPEQPPVEDYPMMEEFLPPPPMSVEPQRESAWERGIRQAKQARKRLKERKAMGIREEPQFLLEETLDDFDMEAEFNPDLRREPPGDYGYGGPPGPHYNPRFPPRERHHEPGPPRREPPREPPPQFMGRPPQYQEPRFREIPRKDQFGRDYSKRMEMMSVEKDRRKQMPKQYPPSRPAAQERGRREERTRPSAIPKKPADDWQDPWARNRSPKPKSKLLSKGRTRSGSLSSASSGSRSRSRSYSSGSSRSSSGSSFSSRSGSRSRSRSPQKTKPTTKTAKITATTKPFGLIPRTKQPPPKTTGLVKMGLTKTAPVKLGLQPTPGTKPVKPLKRSISNSSISSASRSPSPQPKTRPRPVVPPPDKARRRRSSSGSSHVSITSKSSADSEHMYANLASPVSSPSSSERISRKKLKAARARHKFPSTKPSRPPESKTTSRPKQMVTVPSMEAFSEPPVQTKKSKPAQAKVALQPKPKSTSAPAQMTSRNPVKHSTHKEIKLTLLNKPSSDGKKRYEVLGEGASKKVKPVAPVKPTTKVVPQKERRAEKPLQQPTRKPALSAVVTPVRTATVKPSMSDRPVIRSSERKRLPSPFKQRDQPPAKQAHKAAPVKASGASKTRDSAAVKKATISRREEILKQLKAVEDMIARKKAKMKN